VIAITAVVSFARHGLENLFMSSFAFWLTVGFLGQGLFTARFLVQWLASEKERAVVVPPAFWWLSLAGGAALLSYAVQRRDPVIVVGQSMGLFVYVRNLMLEAKKRNRAEAAAGAPSDFGPPSPHFHDERSGLEVSLATRGKPGDRAGRDFDGPTRM
jgi:lipid-A-disaccharide synthase-like uncharacterized protein